MRRPGACREMSCHLTPGKFADIDRMATILKNLPRIGTKLTTKLMVPGLGVIRLGEEVLRALPVSAIKLTERDLGNAIESEYDLDSDGVAEVIRTDALLRGEPYVMLRSAANKGQGGFVIYGGTDGLVHLIDRVLESGEIIVLGDQTAHGEGSVFARVSANAEPDADSAHSGEDSVSEAQSKASPKM